MSAPTFMVIEGERDSLGRAPFTLFWRDSSGKRRAQCFRTRPEPYIERGVVVCATEDEARMRAWGLRLMLPAFQLSKKQPKVPHVARVAAMVEIPNEHGVPVVFTVRQSRSGGAWWISATLRGLRLSNTLHTTAEAKAKFWIECVERSEIGVLS